MTISSQTGQSKIVFATMPPSGGDDREVALLVSSLRRFAGQLSDNPIWVVKDENLALNSQTLTGLKKAEVDLVSFVVPSAVDGFPFASKVFAAMAAEKKAQTDGFDILVWMDSDTIFLQEPIEFILEKTHMLGCRPVQLKLISSSIEDQINEYWASIFEGCGASAKKIYPVETVVDRKLIRANFNAGLLVVRPQLGLLQAWSNNLLRLFHAPIFISYFELNVLYRIFFHQCVLAGTILEKLNQNHIFDFSPKVNYPIFLHGKLPNEQKSASWDELITARYDSMDFLKTTNLLEIMPMSKTTSNWLHNQLEELSG